MSSIYEPMPKLASQTNQPKTLSASTSPVPSLTPAPSPTASPSPSPTAKKRKTQVTRGAAPSSAARNFGVAVSLAGMSNDKLNATLADLKALGVTWVRYDIEWSNIEYAGPGQYDWGTYDRVVQAVRASGLKSLAIIDYSPAWARRTDCDYTPMCAPANPATYADFAGKVAARYAPYGVHHYEIWNEPNITQYYMPAANPAEYATMLRAAASAIRSADRQAKIITGGLSPSASKDGSLSPVDFLNGIYDAGARGSFDALGHHPYTWPYSPGYGLPGTAWAQLYSLHAVMAHRGDGAKQIWITEFGAPTGGPGRLASNGYTTSEGSADHVTEALAARMATDAVGLARSISWIGPFFWYTYKDSGTSTSTIENFFGLVRTDGSRKPAFSAYQRAITAQ